MIRRARNRRTRTGFTLLEVLLVCVLLGIVSGVVLWSVRGRITAARLSQACEQLEGADQLARRVARNSAERVTLRFRGTDNQIEIRRGERRQKLLRLPGGISLSGVRFGRRASRRRGDLEVSRLGQSASYAVALRTEADTERWLVISGLSGQSIIARDAEEADALLRL